MALLPAIRRRGESLSGFAFLVAAIAFVGAMIVAAIETVWSGQVTPLAGHPQRMQFGQPITLEKGAEMGRFKLGSTVVMCFAKPVSFEERPLATMVSMGESLADI